MAKEGSTIGGLMDCFGTAVSMSLQYGVPLEVYVNKFSHTRFEPMGHTKNPDIRIAKSIVDYIFRWLGITFLPGYRRGEQAGAAGVGRARSAAEPGEPEAEPRPAATMAGGPNAAQGPAKNQLAPNGSAPAAGNGRHGPKSAQKRNGATVGAAALERMAATALVESARGEQSRSDQFASFQTDAPSCDNCGAITVRSGNCYLCYNCGTSMGCS